MQPIHLYWQAQAVTGKEAERVITLCSQGEGDARRVFLEDRHFQGDAFTGFVQRLSVYELRALRAATDEAIADLTVPAMRVA